MADRKCFGDVTGWSRATVWFKRPDDVQQTRKSNPVKSLQSLSNRKQAPIAPTESVCMTGAFAGIVTENKKGARAKGDSANDIATAIEKRFTRYVAKSEASKAEREEIAQIARMKREAAKVESKAKSERNAAIRHSSPSQADKQAEIARNEARMRFEEQSLARKVANAEEAASDPALWALEQNEIDAEMAY
jgi:hypothetical protein